MRIIGRWATTAAPAYSASGMLILRRPGSSDVVRNPSAGCLTRATPFTEVTNNTTVLVGTGRSVRVPS